MKVPLLALALTLWWGGFALAAVGRGIGRVRSSLNSPNLGGAGRMDVKTTDLRPETGVAAPSAETDSALTQPLCDPVPPATFQSQRIQESPTLLDYNGDAVAADPPASEIPTASMANRERHPKAQREGPRGKDRALGALRRIKGRKGMDLDGARFSEQGEQADPVAISPEAPAEEAKNKKVLLSPLECYLQEAVRTPVLGRKEERDLAALLLYYVRHVQEKEARKEQKVQFSDEEQKTQKALEKQISQRKQSLILLEAEGLIAAARKALEEQVAQADPARDVHSLRVEELIKLSESLFAPLKPEIAIALGEAAYDYLGRAILRWVVEVAKRYRNRGLSFQDLIQEGNAGLLECLKRYDYSRGCRVSTYATYWIRMSIRLAISQHASAIRLPYHAFLLLNKVSRNKPQWENKLGQALSLQEVGKLMGLSKKQMVTLRIALKASHTLSGHFAADEEPDSVETSPDQQTLAPDEDAASDEQVARRMAFIDRVLKKLSPRDRQILRMRWGLQPYGPEKMTLKEVAAEFHLSRERVRQIEHRAFKSAQAWAKRVRRKFMP